MLNVRVRESGILTFVSLDLRFPMLEQLGGLFLSRSCAPLFSDLSRPVASRIHQRPESKICRDFM